MNDLEERLRMLSDVDRHAVEVFVELLLEKQRTPNLPPPTLEWAGALSDLRGAYSSVELQHAISSWRDPAP